MKWVKIEEGGKLPDENEVVGVWVKNGKQPWYEVAVFENGKFYNDYMNRVHPSHWTRIESPGEQE